LSSCEKEDNPEDLFPPVAAFTSDVTTIDAGGQVVFTDQSTNYPDSWAWDFGDGATSNDQNPTHVYNNHGTYTVSLSVLNSDGNDFETKSDFITVTEVPIFVTDIDGNIYSTIEIGSQIWMAENLKVTKFPDGADIPYITDNIEWQQLQDNSTDKAYCYYNNNLNGEGDIYGALYTWAAAMNGAPSSATVPSNVQGVCPDGWHLPSSDEWWILINGLGGKTIAGGKLKESGISHWNFNEGATNESGFTALPGGYRFGYDGSFYTVSNFGYWWDATEEFESTAWSRELNHMNSQIESTGKYKSGGVSIRCVKD
jgi:uncharacterized protein (TIGR02145 family)